MSIWNKDNYTDKSNKLDNDKCVDVLIIGAGMTGLTTAYYLKDFKNVMVVDAGRIGCGVTLGSTAKINYLQSGVYSKIKNRRGERLAKIYLDSQRYAIGNLKEIIESEEIDCDFENVCSYIFASTEEEVNRVNKEVEFLLNQGIDIKKDKLPLNIETYESYKVDDTYVFNPIKYIEGIRNILEKSKVPVYESTKIVKIEKASGEFICYTEKYKIYAKRVVIATQYPYFNIPFWLPFKSYCEKSYMVISKVKKDGKCTCINTRSPIYSCRFYDAGENVYQISLSGSHNIAFKQNDYDHFKEVMKRFRLKDKNIVMMYSNTDIITPDYLPYIGKIKNGMYVACGFNTWGITNSVLAASVISDEILDANNKFVKYFRPDRWTIVGLVSLPYIIFSQAKSFIGAKVFKNKSWYSNNLKFEREGLKSYGIYTDNEGVTHKVLNKCPHMGCSLIFNEVEKTWDCPCHSSRFDIDGKCIKGPSNYYISVDKQ